MSAASPDTWMQLDPTDRGALPDKPGVYVIYLGNEVVYVGQSNNLRVRFARHNIRRGYAKNIKTPWGDFDEALGIHCKYRVSRRLGDWAMWEIRLITRLRPRFNRTFIREAEVA